MNKENIYTLIHFNFWANGRILTACQPLTPAEFTRKVTPDPGWGSLRGILVHTLDTEYGWRALLQNETDIILKAADFPDVATLKTRWGIEEAAWKKFAASLTAEQLNQGYGENPQDGHRVWQTMMHVLMHSVQHRSEAAAILTGYGHSPGELDFAIFLKENPEKENPSSCLADRP